MTYPPDIPDAIQIASGRASADWTFVRNKATYFPRRQPPTMANRTDYAERCKGAFGTVQTAWSRVLNADDRAAWQRHAETYPDTDRWGQPLPPRGQTAWLSVQQRRILLWADETIQTRPPETPPPDWTAVSITPIDGGNLIIFQSLLIVRVNTPAALDPNAWGLEVKTSRPLAPSQTTMAPGRCLLSHGPKPASLWRWDEPGNYPRTQLAGFRYGPQDGWRFTLVVRWISVDGWAGPWTRLTTAATAG